jgi:tetratricopeptide (TPR) repeat protein
MNRARSKPTENLSAYDCYLRALEGYYALQRNDSVCRYLRRAIDLDPHYAVAKAFLAHALTWRSILGEAEAGDRAKSLKLANEALLADHDNPLILCHAAYALVYFGREYDRALGLADRAVGLNPNSA